MKKIVLLLMLVTGIGAIGFGLYSIFLVPSGFTSEEDLITSYIDNLDTLLVCETHFNQETLPVCEVFVTNLKNEEVSLTSIVVTDDQATVSLDVNGNTGVFTFILSTEEVTGIRGILYSSYYLIDYIN